MATADFYLGPAEIADLSSDPGPGPSLGGPTAFTIAELSDEENFALALGDVLGDVKNMLMEKNAAYGNSVLDPVRIFSQAATDEQIMVRIDDKLSRLQRGHAYPGDDDVDDLIGYLILLKIARK